MEKNQSVSLGCGTLILIALIVLILGNADSDKIREEIKVLRSEVGDLQSSVQDLSQQNIELRKAVEALAPEVRSR